MPDHFLPSEKEAIELGRKLLNLRSKHPPKYRWLCATFMKGDATELDIIMKNAHVLPCDWAVVFYSHSESAREFQTKICDGLRQVARVRRCKQSLFNETTYRHLVEEYTSEPPVKHLNHSGEPAFVKYVSEFPMGDNMFIAKQVLYQEILLYLKYYENVIMMDSDILFATKEFNFTEVQVIWNHGYNHRLKLSQPCIIGKSEFETFKQERWMYQNFVAIGIDYIEQQVFFVNSLVLEWSIRVILAKTRDYHILHLSDWGYDNILCRATKAFTELVLNETVEPRQVNPVCAIMTHHCVQHMDTKVIKKDRLFLKKGVWLFHYYSRLFPHWFFDTKGGLQPEAQDTVHWDVALKPPLYHKYIT